MATKAERILDLLPRTFRAGPTGSPLGALVETYGAELQLAENALAAVMRAHWADHADRGAEEIKDLAKFAALYGLAPRPEDGIEEFRTRLKLWVELILKGPSTVRNLLRATSALLGVAIDDTDAGFDPWWERSVPLLTTRRQSGLDAAGLVLGFGEAVSEGADATPAKLTGRVVLADEVDLTGGAILAVALDGAAPVPVDLGAGAADPAHAPRADIVDQINLALGQDVASISGGRLVLVSATTGTTSAVLLPDGADDAAPVLLGLPARSARGTDERPAHYVSPVDLSGGADLSVKRYVRLDIDGTLAEIDCADGAPGLIGLDAVRDAINAAFGAPVAGHDGTHLSLSSPSTGIGARIVFQQPAAQDATEVLFGFPPSVVLGAGAAPATIAGSVELSRGVDLSRTRMLVLDIDGAGDVTIDCAGADPAATQLPELVATVNAAAGTEAARHNGRNLILQGTVTGPAGALSLGFAGADDVSETLLGLPPRSAQGVDAARARLEGTASVSGGVDLSARSLLSLSLDRSAPVTIDLAEGAPDRSAVSGAQIAAAINAALGHPVAGVSSDVLVLESPAPGAAGSLTVTPVVVETERAFVSRVPVSEDSAMLVLGVPSAKAAGEPAQAARIIGTRSLARGADLQAARHLRLSIDGGPQVDIDCAGPRPRVTVLDEAVAKINGALTAPVAARQGGALALTSPTTGAASRVELFRSQATDARPALLGIEPTNFRGTPATRPAFVGLVDIGAGVDLSAASRLSLAVDGGVPVEIDCAGPDPAVTLPAQIAIRINVAMGVNIASHDGARLTLTTPSLGGGAVLEILAPAAGDATLQILGIAPGRTYQGSDAAAAQIVGTDDLSSGSDLSVARHLRLSVDGAAAVEIDCAAEADDPTSVALPQIIDVVNAAVGVVVASDAGGRLALTAPTAGLSSRLTVEAIHSGDARTALLGDAPSLSQGAAAHPAEIVGEIDITGGVNLSDRSVLPVRTSTRSARIDLSGAAPEATSADEIVAAINTWSPGMASLTPGGTLRLTAPETDPTVIEVPPLRWFEMEEYLSEPGLLTRAVRHGDRLRPDNAGADVAAMTVEFTSDKGVDAPGLVDIGRGWEVRFLAPLAPGETVTLSTATDGGLEAQHLGSDGVGIDTAAGAVFVSPLTPNIRLGEANARRAAHGIDGRRQITLSDPSAPELVIMTQRGGTQGDLVTMTPAAEIPAGDDTVYVGRLDVIGGELVLRDQAGTPRARILDAMPSTALIGAVVAVTGDVSDATDPPTINIGRLFPVLDIAIERHAPDGTLEQRSDMTGVVLAFSADAGSLALEHRLAVDPDALMRAETRLAGEALDLSRGRSEWIFVDALASRFNQSRFNSARFIGPPRFGQGIFNASRFAEEPPAQTTPVFARTPEPNALPSTVSLGWMSRRPGAALITLPKDLPRQFGARFNEDRFALAGDAPLRLDRVVFEPPGDQDFIVGRINADTTVKNMVRAEHVATVPIGFEPVAAPFFQPARLTGGRSDRPARTYLSEAGLAGFVEIRAAEAGAYGNDISLTVCGSEPGRYDLLVAFDGARFENARVAVRGPALTGLTDELIAPGPRGVFHLKAGGVRIDVTRDGLPEEAH